MSYFATYHVSRLNILVILGFDIFPNQIYPPRDIPNSDILINLNPSTIIVDVPFMTTFIVNSAILRSGRDPEACAAGALKMLTKGGIKNVKLKSCYCCSSEGRVAFIVEAESKEAVLDAMNKIDIPVASIMEAEEVKTKK